MATYFSKFKGLKMNMRHRNITDILFLSLKNKYVLNIITKGCSFSASLIYPACRYHPQTPQGLLLLWGWDRKETLPRRKGVFRHKDWPVSITVFWSWALTWFWFRWWIWFFPDRFELKLWFFRIPARPLVFRFISLA